MYNTHCLLVQPDVGTWDPPVKDEGGDNLFFLAVTHQLDHQMQKQHQLSPDIGQHIIGFD